MLLTLKWLRTRQLWKVLCCIAILWSLGMSAWIPKLLPIVSQKVCSSTYYWTGAQKYCLKTLIIFIELVYTRTDRWKKPSSWSHSISIMLKIYMIFIKLVYTGTNWWRKFQRLSWIEPMSIMLKTYMIFIKLVYTRTDRWREDQVESIKFQPS